MGNCHWDVGKLESQFQDLESRADVMWSTEPEGVFELIMKLVEKRQIGLQNRVRGTYFMVKNVGNYPSRDVRSSITR